MDINIEKQLELPSCYNFSFYSLITVEDEDLRIVPAANNKRSSANPIEGAPTKRSKAEKFQG